MLAVTSVVVARRLLAETVLATARVVAGVTVVVCTVTLVRTDVALPDTVTVVIATEAPGNST